MVTLELIGGVRLEERGQYEVIKFIEHDGRCRVTMDYVKGKLLMQWLLEHPGISKEQLFCWFAMLVKQMEQFHRCQKNQCYRYLNPESVLVKEGSLWLLDLEAESNAFVIRDIQKKYMRKHFIKEYNPGKEISKLEQDLYGLGKTIQYMLAHVQPQPNLTKREEYQLSGIIQRCLGTHSKKLYNDLQQIQKDLPKITNPKYNKLIKRTAAIGVILMAAILVRFFSENPVESKEQPIRGMQQAGDSVASREADDGRAGTETDDSGKSGTGEAGISGTGVSGYEQGMEDVIEKNFAVLEDDLTKVQEYMQENTSEDNRKVIEQGLKMERQLLRYLAAAYDREEQKEAAIAVYRRLRDLEVNKELLEQIYLREAALEEQTGQYPQARETYESGITALPDSMGIVTAYIRQLCIDTTISDEECNQKLQNQLSRFPAIEHSEQFQKLRQEYGIKMEGEKVWIEKAKE